MGINEDLRFILNKEKKSIKYLAETATKISSQEITPESISAKLLRGTMKYDEAQFYGEVLGYSLQYVKKS